MGIIDFIDILLVAILLFIIYKRLGNRIRNLFWGILVFVLLWSIAKYVGLKLTGSIFDELITGVAPIALVVIFQDEIRMFFYKMGSRISISELRRIFKRSQDGLQGQKASRDVMQIVLACKNMASTNTGALIIIAQHTNLNEYHDSGELIDANISARLIENIFFKNTPLHDGAMIIENGRIRSAACILPISKNPNIPQAYGLRHRAALGLAECSDVISIVVSEESGKISVAKEGEIHEVELQQLESILSEALVPKSMEEKSNKKK